jgi:hypothetical protein
VRESEGRVRAEGGGPASLSPQAPCKPSNALHLAFRRKDSEAGTVHGLQAVVAILAWLATKPGSRGACDGAEKLPILGGFGLAGQPMQAPGATEGRPSAPDPAGARPVG